MKRLRQATVAAALVLRAAAGPLEDAGRKVYAEYAGAVVPVSAVMRVEMPGSDRGAQEGTVNFYGTIVGADGLTAISATALSPFSGIAAPMDTGGIQPRVSATQIRIHLQSGVSVRMRQVFADDELDIAFLLPDPEPDQPPPKWPKPVIFSPGVEARMFDKVLCLAGTAELLGWSVIGGTGEINAVFGRPRRLYVVSRGFSNMTGVPVFRADGRPLGLAVTRREPLLRTERGLRVQQAVLILPAEAIAEAVKQARQAAAKPRGEPGEGAVRPAGE